MRVGSTRLFHFLQVRSNPLNSRKCPCRDVYVTVHNRLRDKITRQKTETGNSSEWLVDKVPFEDMTCILHSGEDTGKESYA